MENEAADSDMAPAPMPGTMPGMHMEERNRITEEIQIKLGAPMMDVELADQHYKLAIDLALRKYRQRSGNAVIDDYFHLELKLDKSEYDLSMGSEDADIQRNILAIQDIHLRSTGNAGSGVGSELEPFQAQYTNTFLQQSGRAGGLGVYDAIAQHYELIGRIFGSEYQYTWNRVRKSLRIHRRPKADIDVIVECYVEKDEFELFGDTYALPWIESYALAQAKIMLGDIRSKYANYAGPSGGAQLNGDALKADGTAELQQLEDDVKNHREGSTGLGFVIG